MDLSKSLAPTQTPPTVSAQAPTAVQEVLKARVISEKSEIQPGEEFRVLVEFKHEEHWHVYGPTIPEGAFGKPTKIMWDLPEGWVVTPQPWPATQSLVSTDGKTIEGYEGTVYFPYLLKAPASLSAGSEVELKAKFDVLVCDPKECRPMKRDFATTLKVGANSKPSDEVALFESHFENKEQAPADSSKAEAKEPQASLWSFIHLAFIGGLILNVMPCVFPVLGIKIMGIAKQSQGHKSEILGHALAYTFGVLICFWALVFLLHALKSAGSELAWGFQLQSPTFVFILTLGLFAFGLNMAGLFEVGTSAVGAGAQLSQKSGVSGSFFSGLFATVVATPCAAPFLAPTLGFALSLDLLPSLLLFTVMGLGLALPYLLLPFFPQLLKLLPKPGAWMESFKQAMSFLLFGTAAFLLWIYADLVDEYGLLKTLFAIVALAAACWIYGRWFLPHKPKKTRIIGALAALSLSVTGIAIAFPDNAPRLEWREWSPELAAQLEKEGTPVYVDYTARWCVTCQVNKRVYNNPALQKLIHEKKVVLLKADWTNEDPRITRALAELNRAAVPVNTLKKPGEKEVWVLPELLTESNVSEFLNKL